MVLLFHWSSLPQGHKVLHIPGLYYPALPQVDREDTGFNALTWPVVRDCGLYFPLVASEPVMVMTVVGFYHPQNLSVKAGAI